MNNKYYSCPICPQTSSRKWNLQVHLARKHPGLAYPLQKNVDELSSGTFNKYSSKKIIPFTERQGYLDPVSYSLKSLHELLEIESIFDKLSSRGGLESHQIPMCASNSLPPIEEFLNQLSQMSFIPRTDPLRRHISGYERYICWRCLATCPLSFIVIRETGEVRRSQHRCHPRVLAQVQKLTEDERDLMLLHQSLFSVETMQKAIKDQWTDSKSPYLIAKRLASVPRNSYDFSSEVAHGREWLNRVLREESIVLDDEQLKEFLFLSNGNSYVSFSTREGDLLIFQSYFMTLSKEPSLSFDFSIENPEIPPFNLPKNVRLSPDQNLIQLEKEN